MRPRDLSAPVLRLAAAMLPASPASDRRWIKDIKNSEIHRHESPKNDHHLDWLTSIRTRKDTVAPAVAGHRANSVCLLAQIAMHISRVLHWDPDKETFTNESELSRPQRAPYGTNAALEKAGLKS